MRKPLIDAANQVVNIIEIEADAGYTPPEGLTLYQHEAPEGCVIGGTYDLATDTFAPPVVEEPTPEGDA